MAGAARILAHMETKAPTAKAYAALIADMAEIHPGTLYAVDSGPLIPGESRVTLETTDLSAALTAAREESAAGRGRVTAYGCTVATFKGGAEIHVTTAAYVSRFKAAHGI